MKKIRVDFSGIAYYDITDEQYADIFDGGLFPDEVIDPKDFWEKADECIEVDDYYDAE